MCRRMDDGQTESKSKMPPYFFSKFGALLNFKGKNLISGSEEL